MEPISLGVLSISVLAGLGTASWTVLKGWQGWLELKRMELCQGLGDRPTPHAAGGRIEIADLRERVRKLEAIAAGIDI
ncbi:MAG TPA: hypothetical protein VF637_06180 [Sphingomicrobium sp.]